MLSTIFILIVIISYFAIPAYTGLIVGSLLAFIILYFKYKNDKKKQQEKDKEIDEEIKETIKRIDKFLKKHRQE